MPRARNMVIAGDYEGKFVGNSGTTLYIILRITQTLNLDRSNIQSIELIDESSDISVGNAAARGLIGEMFLGPVGLLAAATAPSNERYIVGIVFRDEKRSVLELDEKLYRLLIALNQ